MIKFFRKIRYNLMEQNKTGKYFKYAIGEIILVVIGILIALSINNWNENRKDRNKEISILKALHKDFKNNLNDFNRIKELHINTLNKQNIVLRNIDKFPNPKAIDSIFNYGKNMFGGYTYNASNGTIESLISSGDINLITNDTLKNYLVSWKDVLEDYSEEEIISQRLWHTAIEPYMIKKGLFYKPDT
ncbi:DUF6090 family protein [Hwangdonia seohaensis]|uniref:DUF6090 family protein n=2 Tax=Hwangdonia seohaensis TaxID=1240727 RepID=A0ABW3RCR5_9FLAO|nr:DUF6090 family protein [Hwangdonia seohaensis]